MHQTNNLPVSDKLMKSSYKAINKLRTKIFQKGQSFNKTLMRDRSKKSVELEKPNPQDRMQTKNGIATFTINAEGEIARSPERILVQKVLSARKHR